METGNHTSYKFTIFTPSFNRGHILKKLYEGLKDQTFKDFEWIVVDDGSTDSTKEIVLGWVKEGIFPIKYIRQENQGKHIAINVGVRNASGELFLIVDSDDACVSNALERLLFYWDAIPNERKNSFSGVFSNCLDTKGNLIGSKFPEDVFDGSLIDVFYKFNVKGDKWGFYKTEILMRFPFPSIKGERFLSEALVWNRIAKIYKARFVNEGLLIANYQRDGLSSLSLPLRVRNPLGASLYYKEFLSLPVKVSWKLRNFINYVRFSFHARKSVLQQIFLLDSAIFKFLYPFLLLVGYAYFIADKKRLS